MFKKLKQKKKFVIKQTVITNLFFIKTLHKRKPAKRFRRINKARFRSYLITRGDKIQPV